jgi:hypothetical protein
MCEPFARQKRLVEIASDLIAAGRGQVKIGQAMTLAGFTSPERRNMKIYQQVRRRSAKVAVVEIPKGVPTVDGAVNSTVSIVSSLTGETIDGTPESGSCARRPLFIEEDNDDASSSTAATGKRGPYKKARCTSKEVQRKHAIKAGCAR